MSESPHTKEFVAQLTGCQNQLYAYILSLVLDTHAADEVLQAPNLVVWEKAGEFAPDPNFAAWASTFVFFEVLSYPRDRRRDRHVFDDDLVERLAPESASLMIETDDRRHALHHCMKTLSEEDRTTVTRRYAGGAATSQIAREQGKTPVAVQSSLYRIRRRLLECIQRRMLKDRDRD